MAYFTKSHMSSTYKGARLCTIKYIQYGLNL